MRASKGRPAAVRQRVGRARTRIDASAAGQLQHRIVELALMNQALILSALALMLFVPALITLAAVLPLGSSGGMADAAAHRVGLSTGATRDLQQLFASRQTIRNATTGAGAIVTMLFAYSWPATLKRGYETIWGLEPRGRRDLWRPLVWLVAFFAAVAAAVGSGALAHGVAGSIVTALIATPIAIVWSWWSQHLLLAGRVPWRALLPGAVTLALALAGLRLFMHFYLSRTIQSDYRSYGPIGVVFVLQSWFIAFSVVMLGAPLFGHFLHRRRHLDLLLVGEAEPTEGTGGVRLDGNLGP